MGTDVVGGMLAATGIAIFIIPMTFYLVETLSHRFSKEKKTERDKDRNDTDDYIDHG